jgi:hypothetical protein
VSKAVAADFGPCPKYRARMTYVAVTPHPMASEMQGSTYVCRRACNQTRICILPAAAAKAAEK